MIAKLANEAFSAKSQENSDTGGRGGNVRYSRVTSSPSAGGLTGFAKKKETDALCSVEKVYPKDSGSVHKRRIG